MYHWFLKVKIKCNPQQPNQLDYVEGWIQKVHKNPALSELLKQAQPQQKVKIYAEKGIWYDAIASASDAGVVRCLLLPVESLRKGYLLIPTTKASRLMGSIRLSVFT
jgi:Domain of Unknown Function (DUF928)